MTLFTWPESRTSILIFYNTFMAIGSSTLGYLVNKYLGFAVFLFWCLFFSYDLYARQILSPQSEMSEDEKMRAHFEEWMNNQANQNQQRMRRIGERLQTIENDYGKLKGQYKDLREEKRELEVLKSELEQKLQELEEEDVSVVE